MRFYDQYFSDKTAVLKAMAFAVLVTAIMVFPDMVFAAAKGDTTADATMGLAVGYFQKFLIMILYAFEGLVFVAGAWWIIKSVSDWKQGERNSGIGDIVITVFVAVAVIGIVFLLATKGIAIVTDNVKLTVTK